MSYVDLKTRCYRLALALYWLWAQGLCRFRSGRSPATPKLMIVPCEPWSIVGSRGDEAMIMAIIQNFQKKHPGGDVVIVSGVPKFEETPDGQRLGVRFLHAWRGRIPLRAIFEALCAEAPSECYILGADCMDGHYSVWTSLILLSSADLSHRLGIETHLTGFSFNEHPAKTLLPYYRFVSGSFVFNVRDEVSLGRFEAKTRLRARLVADVAFNLVPEPTAFCAPHEEWARAQKAQGRLVIGFNLHGMLVPKDMTLEAFAQRVCVQLAAALERCPELTLLFIPHDYRCGGDGACLLPVYQPLSVRFPDRVRLVEDVFSAAQLKGLCAALNGLFTSRMHLGIAALGMGVPVMGFAYQGKFGGLWKHFELPQTYCLNPEEIGSDELVSRLQKFLPGLVDLQAQVALRLPHVKALAGLNFEDAS